MRRRCRRAALAPLLAAAGCASWTPPPAPYLEAWVGQGGTTLRRVWGMPTEWYPAGEFRLLLYRTAHTGAFAWLAPAWLECEVTFGLYRDRVATADWIGDRGLCSRMARAHPVPEPGAPPGGAPPAERDAPSGGSP